MELIFFTTTLCTFRRTSWTTCSAGPIRSLETRDSAMCELNEMCATMLYTRLNRVRVNPKCTA